MSTSSAVYIAATSWMPRPRMCRRHPAQLRLRHRISSPRRYADAQGQSRWQHHKLHHHRGAPRRCGFAVYAGAKAATTNFTRALAVELGKHRIRVNTLAPDTTPSEGNMKALDPRPACADGEDTSTGRERVHGHVHSDEVPTHGGTIWRTGCLFLASDLSAFVTGTTLHVDGGTMASAGFIDWPFDDGYLPVPMDGTLSRLFRSG